MNVWFHSNENDWENPTIDSLKKKGIWKNVYSTNKDIKGNPFAVKNYFIQSSFIEYSNLPINLAKYMQPHLYKFIDMFSRNSKNDQNSYIDFQVHEYLNIFNLIINYYYRNFIEKEIDLVFFNRAPHVGYDYISYHIAKYLNLKTLILEQSQFPNRFYYYWEHDDFGTFKTSQVKFEHPFISIDKKFEKELGYMKNIGNKRIRSKADLYKRYPSIKLIRELMDHDLRSSALLKYSKNKIFLNNHLELEVSEDSINFETPYIYFGLHLQPEKTTSSWGGIYTDQVLAIEHLSSKLPPGWKIYVKENPKQGYYMRDSYFYERLSKIPQVILVNRKINTYKLLKNCKIAATITGTIGWECITGGKPAIYFGWGTWYKTFPGVYEFDDDIDLIKIIDGFTPLKKEEIEEKLNQILDFTGKGVIYNKGWYKELVNNYSKANNINNIANSLERILI